MSLPGLHLLGAVADGGAQGSRPWSKSEKQKRIQKQEVIK